MSEHTDEPQDWPLRDWSSRLRPPDRPKPEENEPEAEPDAGEAPEPLESVPPAFSLPESSPDAEILYDEDDPDRYGIRPVAPGDDEPVPAEPEQPAERVEAAAWPGTQPAVEPDPAVEPEPEPEHAEGEFRVPGGYSVLEGAPTGGRRTVAVVVSRFNGEITNKLLESALLELDEAGVARDAVLVMPVPGAFELPIAAMALAKSRRYSCVVALGCVIRGETPHFDFVASEAASGLQLAGIETGVPVSFGLLTTDTAEQAEARVERGAAAARAALEMADAFSQLRAAAARQ